MKYPQDIVTYIEELFRRRGDGRVIPRGELHNSNWKPLPKECHRNVDTYCHYCPDHSPVRGWLFFDYEYALGYVSFLQHSVLKLPNGTVYDITPAHASQDYPFIEVKESDESFFEKEKHTDNGNLYYKLPAT